MRFAIVVLVATSAGISGGLLAGAVADAEPSKTHVRYDAWITSSAGAPNTNVTLTCGWHADNCYGTPGGDALDWTASNTAVYLRGGFKRQYTSGVSGSYLYGWRFGAIFNDPANCEEAVVDVKEPGTNRVWFGLHMLHVYSNFQPNSFAIWVSSGATGYFGHYLITSYMTNSDAGSNCIWTNPHVHDWIIPVNINMGTYRRAPQVPNAPGRIPSISNGAWMRYFSWQGG